VVPHL